MRGGRARELGFLVSFQGEVNFGDFGDLGADLRSEAIRKQRLKPTPLCYILDMILRQKSKAIPVTPARNIIKPPKSTELYRLRY